MWNRGPANPVAKPDCVLVLPFCSVDFWPYGCTLNFTLRFFSELPFLCSFCRRSQRAAPAAEDKATSLWLRRRLRHSEGWSPLIRITPHYNSVHSFVSVISFCSQKRSASAHSTLLQSNQLLLCFVLHTQESHRFCSKRKAHRCEWNKLKERLKKKSFLFYNWCWIQNKTVLQVSVTRRELLPQW